MSPRGIKETAFVIAPIGTRESETRKRSDDIFEQLIRPVLTKLGYEPLRADKIAETGIITNQIFEHILKDPLVIADMTGHNPNVFYELAVRHTIQKPTILLIDEEEKLPFDVQNLRTIKLHKNWRGLTEAKKELAAHVKSFHETPICESPVTPSMRFFPFSKLIDKKLAGSISEEELARLFKISAEGLRTGGKGANVDIYTTLDEFVLKNIDGVTTENRKYDLKLEPDYEFGISLLRVDLTTSYSAVNSDQTGRPLFVEGGTIERGTTTIPSCIAPKQIPRSSKKIFSYARNGFSINGKSIKPEAFVRWACGKQRSEKVVKHAAKLERTIRPGERVDVSFRCSMLQDETDYILRQHRAISRQRITVNVSKPKGIEVFVIWFLTAREPLIKVNEPNKGPTHFTQTIDGTIIPGNGFAICWRPARRYSRGRKRNHTLDY